MFPSYIKEKDLENNGHSVADVTCSGMRQSVSMIKHVDSESVYRQACSKISQSCKLLS